MLATGAENQAYTSAFVNAGQESAFRASVNIR